MNSKVKNISIILIGVIFLNFILWFFYGKEQILLKGSDIEEISTWAGGVDTLYLFLGEVDAGHFQQYSDFKPTTINKFTDRLNSKGIIAIIDERTFPLITGGNDGRELLDMAHSNTFALDVMVDYKFPLIAEVHKSIWTPGFGTNENNLYFWFFGWHYLFRTGSGIS